MSGGDGLVNRSSDRYMQVNNCGIQTRTDHFTVTRSNGWKDYHILLIISGTCIVYFQGKAYRLLPGHVAFYAPGEAQKYCFPEPCESYWVHFSGKAVPEILVECGFSSGVYSLTPDTRLSGLFSEMISRFNGETTRVQSNASMIELLYDLAQRTRHPGAQPDDPGIRAVRFYLDKHYDRTVTLEDLSRRSGYSRSRFSYLFKKVTGCTPLDYQRNIRLNTSCDLLLSTSLSVSEIAARCGYDDPIYFTKLFRRRFCLSPTRYRKENLTK